MANEFFTDEYTNQLQKLIQEVVNDPETFIGSSILPSVAISASKVRNEVIEATGGRTKEHRPGTDPKYVQHFGTRVQEFKPAYYKESMLFDEERILYLRQLGQNDPSKRGIRQYIDKSIDQLNRRIETRIEYERWQAIFNGGFTWMGSTISFGIPSGNTAVPVGALWSLDGVNANPAADPIADLRYWLLGGYAKFRKYKVKKVRMNPNTARWILDNPNTRSWVESLGGNSAIMKWDLNTVVGFLISGCPAIEVYDGWYQEETITASKITVGDAIYFLPDGKLYFEVGNLPNGDTIGNFTQTIHLASGSMEEPGKGKFLVVEECIAPGTRGGPKNPFIEITGGVYGAPNLERPFDVLTADVLA